MPFCEVCDEEFDGAAEVDICPDCQQEFDDECEDEDY